MERKHGIVLGRPRICIALFALLLALGAPARFALAEPTDAAASQSGESQTMKKSEAEGYAKTLPNPPLGKTWTWVTDEMAYEEETISYVASDGRVFESEDEAKAYAQEHQIGYRVARSTVTVEETGHYELKDASGSWMRNGRGWWYQYETGAYPIGQWLKIDGAWYWFDASGYMSTGWIYAGGSWYYLEPSGAMATGWRHLDGSWYYLRDSGAMATGWFLDDGTWYYADASGAMKTGWLGLNGTWYYLSGSGAMATGWQSIGGVWYYMEPSGAMRTGWFLQDGTWYYLAGSGAMQTGWQLISGSWYYFYGSGAMAASCWVGNYYLSASGAMATSQWIDGYYVGSDGAWIPGYGSGGESSGWDGVTVYWTPNGKAWHKSRSCPSLSRSYVIQGTLSQVGSRTMCKVCGGH